MDGQWGNTAPSFIGTAVESPVIAWLFSVFMVSADDGWAVGGYGTILHWDGKAWRPVASPTTDALFSVSLVSTGEGWAVGNQGTILRWDGSAWQLVASPTTNQLTGVAMVSATDGWAVGGAWASPPIQYAFPGISMSTILHWDGVRWTPAPTPPSTWLYSVAMVSPDEGWALGFGGVILHYGPIVRDYLPIIAK
jgi:photosystem II stability/assembly factor-like uncharacterized protein